MLLFGNIVANSGTAAPRSIPPRFREAVKAKREAFHPGRGEPLATVQSGDRPATRREIRPLPLRFFLVQVDFSQPVMGEDAEILLSRVLRGRLETGRRRVEILAPIVEISQQELAVGESGVPL